LTNYFSHLGDGYWGFCCRRYERTLNRLVDLAEGDAKAWLKVVRDGLKMNVLVGGWPIRIYRGDPDYPSGKCRIAGTEETAEFQQSLPGMSPPDGWFWTIAVEHDAQLRVARVIVEEVHAKESPRRQWAVPIDLAYRSVDPRADVVIPFEQKPDVVGPLKIGPKTRNRDTGEADG
jgi:hypothetical protein